MATTTQKESGHHAMGSPPKRSNLSFYCYYFFIILMIHWIQARAFLGPASLRLLRPTASAFWSTPFSSAVETAPSLMSPPSVTKPSRPSSKLGAKSKKRGLDGNPNTLYRADKVLKERSQRPRSECNELLRQRRVWQKVPITHNPDDDVDDDILLDFEMSETGFDFDWVAVPGPSSRLSMRTRLWVDRAHEVPLPPPLLRIYHKPKWVLSVTKDPHGRPCLPLTEQLTGGMHPVGRLDYDSSGLLLWSSSGEVTQKLLHPKHGIAKVYDLVVKNRVEEEKLRETLAAGVQTSDGLSKADLLSAEPFAEEEVAPYLADIRAKIPAHYNQTDLKKRGYLDVFDATELTRVTVRVHEGKYRIVRRIMYNAGHEVVTLTRREFGKISLGDLPVGEFRDMTEAEEAWVLSLFPFKSSHAGRPKRKKAE